MSCLKVYAERYAPLLSEMGADLQEFLATGGISGARRLTAATGQLFNADQLPQYFTGDLDGPVVLVHLNPKQASASGQLPGWQTKARTLDEYFDARRDTALIMLLLDTQPSSPLSRRNRSSRRSSSTAPSRSPTSAAVRCTLITRPRVSTSRWRLRPLTRLAPS